MLLKKKKKQKPTATKLGVYSSAIEKYKSQNLFVYT